MEKYPNVWDLPSSQSTGNAAQEEKEKSNQLTDFERQSQQNRMCLFQAETSMFGVARLFLSFADKTKYTCFV